MVYYEKIPRMSNLVRKAIRHASSVQKDRLFREYGASFIIGPSY